MVDKAKGKRPISGPRLEWEDNIKIGLKKEILGQVEYIYLS